jgi:Probable zinc-ribbon domain
MERKVNTMTKPVYTSCDQWSEKLAMHREELSPSDRAELEAHLAVCSICTMVYTDFRMMHRLIQNLPIPDFPSGLPARIRELWQEEDSNRLNEKELTDSVNSCVVPRSSDSFADQTLHCGACDQDFLFTTSDQAFYQERGVMEKPKYCQICLRSRMNGRTSLDDVPSSHGNI